MELQIEIISKGDIENNIPDIFIDKVKATLQIDMVASQNKITSHVICSEVSIHGENSTGGSYMKIYSGLQIEVVQLEDQSWFSNDICFVAELYTEKVKLFY